MARPRKKNVRKKQSKLTNKQQLQLQLPSCKARPQKAISTPKKLQTKLSWNKLFSKIMLCINLALCVVLLYLLIHQYLNPPINNSATSTSAVPAPATTTSSSFLIPEDENTFLSTALNKDEDNESKMFILENKLRENNTEFELPDETLQKNIPLIDNLKLSDEQSYELYEEYSPDADHINQAQTNNLTTHTQQPIIVIVIDDMGINIKRTQDIISLRYPLTSSFLTYASNLQTQIKAAQDSGHEIMAHVPMEPQIMQNFIPTMLTTSMSDEQITTTLQQMLKHFPNIKAINNHMGSKFTENKRCMDIVMQELSQKNLIFLDSKTTQHSVCEASAQKYNIKLVTRNVFLDNKDDFDYITSQLHQTEKIARHNGYAIAIGHPKLQTYRALKAWLPTLEKNGFQLLHLSKAAEYINQ